MPSIAPCMLWPAFCLSNFFQIGFPARGVALPVRLFLLLAILPLVSGCISSEHPLLSNDDFKTPLPTRFILYVYERSPSSEIFTLHYEAGSPKAFEVTRQGKAYVPGDSIVPESDPAPFYLSAIGHGRYLLMTEEGGRAIYLFASLENRIATIDLLDISRETTQALSNTADRRGQRLLRDVTFKGTAETLFVPNKEALSYLAGRYLAGDLTAKEVGIYFWAEDAEEAPPPVVRMQNGHPMPFTPHSLADGGAYGNSSGCHAHRQDWSSVSEDLVLVTREEARRWEQMCSLSNPNDRGRPMEVTCGVDGNERKAIVKLYANPEWPDVLVYEELDPSQPDSDFITELNLCE